MVDAGNAAGLEEAANLLQGTAANHYGGRNNEVDAD
jgi:hypothetical protein